MIDENDNPYQIPKNWVWTSVGQLYSVVGGGTPSTKNPKYWNGNIPWITSADIHGIKDIKPRKNVTIAGIKESATNLVPEGSLIVVTRVGLGKIAITKIPLCFSQDSQALIGINEFLNPEYSLYYLSKAVQIFKYKHRGTTIAGVTKKQLKNLRYPLPPLKEQERIVCKLEELFTKLDAGVASLQNVKAQLQLYRQAVLKHAFNGKLTEEWRQTHKITIEPASTLLEQIRQEQKKKGKLKRATKIDTSNLPKLPETWTWTKIDDVETFIGSGITPRGGRRVYVKKGIPFIRSQNVYPDGLHLENVAHVKPELHDAMKRTKTHPKDVLLNITGASIGRSTYIPDEIIEANVNQHVCIIRTGWWLDPSYLSGFLNSQYGQAQIFSTESGMTRQALNYTQIRNLIIPLAPLLEQRIVTEKIEEAYSLVDEAERIIEENLLRSGKLRQSVLKIAFEGRLVAQDPSDEPAERLLERIKLEKERSNQKKGLSRRKISKRNQRRIDRYVK